MYKSLALHCLFCFWKRTPVLQLQRNSVVAYSSIDSSANILIARIQISAAQRASLEYIPPAVEPIEIIYDVKVGSGTWIVMADRG